jgi:hypothetical protein
MKFADMTQRQMRQALADMSKREIRAALTNLKKARRLIARKGGFVKGTFNSNYNTAKQRPESFCTVGAIKQADGPGEESAKLIVGEAIRDLYYPKRKTPLDEGRIFTFNDSKKRTQEEVVAAFDKAVQIAEARMAIAEATAQAEKGN